MENRLKNIVLCTLVFSKGKLIFLGIIEMLMVLGMILVRILEEGTETYDSIFYGNDLLIIVWLFAYGLTFYESHLALCKQNAVSDKYRMLSQLIIAAGLSLAAAVFDSVTRGVITLGHDFSIAELIRISVAGGFFKESNIVGTIIEVFSMYFMFFSLGLVICAIKEKIGTGFTLIGMLLVAFGCLAGVITGQFTWINPVAWMLGIVPAFMMQNMYLAVFFYIVVALGANLAAYSIGIGKKPVRAQEV